MMPPKMSPRELAEIIILVVVITASIALGMAFIYS